jgi:ABC-type nitrate/sulfonate/bicarbonate transport system ATPase subunit
MRKMALKIENLSKSFGDKVIFTSFSYEFPENGLFVLNGISGKGKTTLLRIIAGLDTDYEGAMKGGGIENTSFAFQEYRLFPTLSALENVVVPNGNIKDEKLKKQGAEFLSLLGFSIEDMKLKPASLSGGMKQRVSIARALMRKKPILLLDEPSKELDDALRQILYKLIYNEANERLVILVTHNKEELINDGIVYIDI